MKLITKIGIGLAAIMIIFAFLACVGYHDLKRTERIELSKDYEILVNQDEKLRDSIIDIEQKHITHGMIYFSDFSDHELRLYLGLLGDLIKNNKDIYDLIIANELFLKDKGMTDLQIQEQILELKQANEEFENKRIKISGMLRTKDLLY